MNCDLPKGWVLASLGNLVDFQYGKALIESKRDQTGTVPVYGSNGLVGNHSIALTDRPSIIVGRKGAAGEVHLCNVPCWAIDTTYFVYVPEAIDIRFLYFSMSFVRLSSLDKSTAIPGLNRNDAYKVNIPLPPFPEQRRIVTKIEELFTRLDVGVEALKKIQIQLKRYRQSVLKSAFSGELTAEWRKAHKDELEPASVLLEEINAERKKSGKYKELPPLDTADLAELPEGWRWVRIGEVESFIGSGITPRGGKNVYVSSGIIFIRSQNVHPGGLRLDDVAYITPEINSTMERSIALPGDVLLNITGASIGRSTSIPESFQQANVNQHVCIIRMYHGILPKYLSFFLNSTFGQAQIFLAQGGVTRQGLNYSQVRSISFPFPSTPEQQKLIEEIERYFSIADEVESTIKQSLTQSERLRQSILKKAFEGKLVPQNPNDEPAEKLLERITLEKVKARKVIINVR